MTVFVRQKLIKTSSIRAGFVVEYIKELII